MVKKSSTKKPKINKLWFAFIVLLSIQIITIGYIVKFHTNNEHSTSSSLARLINESESKRYMTPIISVSENRVYIPEFRIFIPLTDISRKLQYSTSPNFKANLYLSTTDVVGNQKSNDDPSCDKMVQISTSKDVHTAEKYISEITPTKDGLRYIYQNNRKCSIYPAGANDKLVELAQSIQQY